MAYPNRPERIVGRMDPCFFARFREMECGFHILGFIIPRRKRINIAQSIDRKALIRGTITHHTCDPCVTANILCAVQQQSARDNMFRKQQHRRVRQAQHACMEPWVRPLESGMQLREYRLEHRIGRGGEGDVWYAKHLRGQAAAIKARPHTDDKDSQRFRAEFARLRTLRIPGIVRVVDAGADQGYLFFAMEVAEGVPFDQFVASIQSDKGRVEQLCAAGAQVARTLASIHRLGLAHRDIKPANIHVKANLIETDLEVVVLDFGTHHFGNSAEETGAIRGTPAYMAPEQRLGMPHDHRVDIHSLGTVLHEAISGQSASSVPPGQRRPSLVGRGPHIPLPLAHLIDRMLDLDPSERPSAEEAEAVLHGIAFHHHLHPRPGQSRYSWV